MIPIRCYALLMILEIIFALLALFAGLTIMAMSATIVTTDAIVLPAAAAETQPQQTTTKLVPSIEIEFVQCDCCGLTEECTPAYIEHVRERYQGHWICGLCAEAIKDEIVRSQKRLISTEEAMATHMNFCKKFKASGPPPNPTIHLISAMRQILRRSLDSPRGGLRSTPSSPTKINAGKGLTRSESCFPTLTG